jgi:hypothetical protein
MIGKKCEDCSSICNPDCCCQQSRLLVSVEQGSTEEKVCKWHTRYIIGGTRFVYMDCKSNPRERLTIYCEHCGGKVELEEEQ